MRTGFTTTGAGFPCEGFLFFVRYAVALVIRASAWVVLTRQYFLEFFGQFVLWRLGASLGFGLGIDVGHDMAEDFVAGFPPRLAFVILEHAVAFIGAVIDNGLGGRLVLSDGDMDFGDFDFAYAAIGTADMPYGVADIEFGIELHVFILWFCFEVKCQ